MSSRPWRWAGTAGQRVSPGLDAAIPPFYPQIVLQRAAEASGGSQPAPRPPPPRPLRELSGQGFACRSHCSCRAPRTAAGTQALNNYLSIMPRIKIVEFKFF